MAYRKNDSEAKTWFRSARVYRSDGQWYFHTREGIEVGPYQAQFEAEVDAEMLKFLLVDLDEESARAIIKAFMLENSPANDGLNAAFTDYLLADDGGSLREKTA